MPIETGEPLTLNEMIEKYPDRWLFIVDPEINSDTSELISGIVTARSDLRDDIYTLYWGDSRREIVPVIMRQALLSNSCS